MSCSQIQSSDDKRDIERDNKRDSNSIEDGDEHNSCKKNKTEKSVEEKCEHCDGETDLKDDINGTKICKDCESCPICMDCFNKSSKEVITIGKFCDHKFCKKCIKSILDIKCPLCRAEPDYLSNFLAFKTVEEVTAFFLDFVKCDSPENYTILKPIDDSYDSNEFQECNESQNSLALFPVDNRNLTDFVNDCFEKEIGTLTVKYYDNTITKMELTQTCGCISDYNLIPITKEEVI
jgi:hypothetical protein